MPTLWVCFEIMKYSWHVCHLRDKNLISLLEMSLKIIRQASEILFFGAIIEGEDDEIGCNKKENKKEGQPYESLTQFDFDGIDRQVKGDKKEWQKIYKIS
jgi:hypothetical protein